MLLNVAFLIDRAAAAPVETYSNSKIIAFVGLFQVQ